MNTEPPHRVFRAARDYLLRHRDDYDTARRGFRWPELSEFNWAFDWFDEIARDPANAQRYALWLVEEDGTECRRTFPELSERSGRVAAWLRTQGVRRGDRLLLMLGNQVELWETILAVMKLGAVIIPASTLLGPADVRDRIERGGVRHVVARSVDTEKFAAVPGDFTRVAVGEPVTGWLPYSESEGAAGTVVRETPTRADEPLLLYFTSGTTAEPKLVQHTHVSYPVGHLSTMYWIGLEPGDVHLNVSSPGWAKHAWSNLFAPWNAEATVFVYNFQRFDAAALMRQMDRCGVTSFCAPPTVWRMLIQADLSALKTPPRELVGAGEPLNPEVIEQVRAAWGGTIRDGFGQTETSVQIANTPAQPIKPGSMGRPVPGFTVELLDPISGEPAREGEICLDLTDRPIGLMSGYADDTERSATVFAHGYYHTGDVASIDDDGYITYIGRTDDVFKASDYRISPFELESVLLEHEAVAEAAVVPAPDPIRLAVPKAYVVLAAGHDPTADTASRILSFCRQRMPPYARVRRVEFADLPKTISGKIRRVELRQSEVDAGETRRPGEFREEDFS